MDQENKDSLRAHPVTLSNATAAHMSKVERLKQASEGLFYVQVPDSGRHTFASEIEALSAREAETIGEQAKEIAKTFGIYKQRVRNESGKKIGEFIFMVRVKNPAGGELTAEQWLALDDASDHYGDGSLRLTARQGIQFHFVRGENLHPLVRRINASCRSRGYQLTTLGACGDVNRNTVASPIDDLDRELPLDSHALAHQVASELAPRTSAYYQVFLSDEKGHQIAPLNSEEPIYGPQYLPRKFKIGFAHPHDNSVDLLTNDIGFMPVVGDRGSFELYSGGGMGMTHNNPTTMPLLALHLGRISRPQLIDTVRAIVTMQKEHGERKNRRAARWKYTIRRLGLEGVKRELRDHFGIALNDSDEPQLPPVRDHLGWYPEAGEGHHLYAGILIPFGRVANSASIRYRSAIRKIVSAINGIGVRITPNQHLILAHIPQTRREFVERTLTECGVPFGNSVAPLRKLAMACPAKPTCGLAMTHAEHALPCYLAALEREGLGSVDVMIRMAGCPNGCSRPPTAEIGIAGYGKNDYVLMVGGARNGSRLARTLYPRLGEEQLSQALIGLVRGIRDRNPHRLSAGEFLHRSSDADLRALAAID
ncbi:MAG TPA: NADPH-dependent assimilatory sulfite reductase hemoprotein subunit [Candidatus Binataceae bacterium]|nr:NADPH-dependent assimilatory sulfite reductase hemoprotein subunit [Candidatus Binataceae bacterium]